VRPDGRVARSRPGSVRSSLGPAGGRRRSAAPRRNAAAGLSPRRRSAAPRRNAAAGRSPERRRVGAAAAPTRRWPATRAWGRGGRRPRDRALRHRNRDAAHPARSRRGAARPADGHPRAGRRNRPAVGRRNRNRRGGRWVEARTASRPAGRRAWELRSRLPRPASRPVVSRRVVVRRVEGPPAADCRGPRSRRAG